MAKSEYEEKSKRMLSLGSFIGNRRVIDTLCRAVNQERLPHALIFAGQEGLGKTTAAILLAQHINCMDRHEADSCGECSACRKILAVLQARTLTCLTPKGKAACGSCRNCRLLAGQHPDIRLIQPEEEKTTISVKQVRDMINEISYQPFEARVRVVILDPADQMRAEAMNSLLKTLEEPPSQTVMILVTTTPFMLPVTIRSRARIVQFSAISSGEIEKYLVQSAQRKPEDARLAAMFSNGSIGTALAFDVENYLKIRENALRFVSLLFTRRGFAEVSRSAAALAKNKEEFETWLEAVAAILQDIYYAFMAPVRVGQIDIRAQIQKLAGSTTRKEVLQAIHSLKKLKAGLQFNVNRQLAVESFYLSQIES